MTFTPKGCLKNYYTQNNEYVIKTHAEFAPLWQLAGAAGGIAGGIKGGLEQDDSGRQITAGERLMRVGTNALAGGVLGGSVGASVPQLIKESSTARIAADKLNDVSGINVDPTSIPLSLKERIKNTRAAKAANPRSQSKISRTLQNVGDVASQGIEDVNSYVVNPAKAVGQAVGKLPGQIEEIGDNLLLTPLQRQLKQNSRAVVEQSAAQLKDQAIQQGINNRLYQTVQDSSGNLIQIPSQEVNELTSRTVRLANDQIANAQKTAIGRAGGAGVGATVGGTIGATLGSVVPGLGTAIGGTVGGTVGAAIGKSKGIKRIAQDVGNTIEGVKTTVTNSGLPQQLSQGAANIKGNIQTTGSTLGNNIQTTGNTLANNISSSINNSTLPQQISQSASNLGNTVSSAANTAASNINASAQQLGTNASAALNNTGRKAATAINNATRDQQLASAGRAPLVPNGRLERIDRSGKNWLNKRLGTNFADEFSTLSNFGNLTNPYKEGAKVGAIGGAVVGSLAGGLEGINQGVNSDQKQLDNIQAISDPYERKKEWETYDNDYSRAGRAIGNTTNTVGKTGLGAGLGLGAGALLGGTALTSYNNVRNKKFNLLGQPKVSRMDALGILIKGQR